MCEIEPRSPDPEVVPRNLTVKFKLNENQTVAQVYSNQLCVDDAKKDIGKKFNIDPKYLALTNSYNDQIVNEEVKLYEMCNNDFGILEFKLELNMDAHDFNRNATHRSELIALNMDVYYSNYKLPEIIPVMIYADDNGETAAKRLIVNITNKPILKPFLCGYVDKQTKIEYHNAFSQTGPYIEHIKWSGIVTKATQTHHFQDSAYNTPYDRSTQVFGDATKTMYVQAVTDYYITPKPYETYDQMVLRINKLGKIILIQRNWRRYLLEKLIKESAAEWRRFVCEQNRCQELRETKLLNRYKRECIVKSFPKTREDFNVLYAEVHTWKKNEVKRINQLYSDGPRVAEMNILLDKEVQLLNGIERQRLLLKNELNSKRTEKLLDDLGAPIKWIGYQNIVCEIDLLRTQRIRFLASIYREMKLLKPRAERLMLIDKTIGILLNEKQSKNVQELLPLLYRENELLNRNVSDDTLETLRHRQLVMFVDFIKEHMSDRKQQSVDKKMCKECKSVRPLNEFTVNTRQEEINVCKKCAFLKFPRVDSTIYRAILRSIRRDERQRSALSSYAFIIQEEDIKEIVEKIWHGHSIISQCSNRKELRLPRWNIGLDWAPWNCVLLTDEETRIHTKLHDIKLVYSEQIIKNIESKHMLSQMLFKKLAEINFDFVQSGEWWNVGLNGKTV